MTAGQSIADYTLAFNLFKAVTDNDGFAGQGHPLVFVTDDSLAEQTALHDVWPESNLHLCLFHVLHAVWRWLWDTKHSIDQEDRKTLMQSFQQLVRSTTEGEAVELYASGLDEDSLWNKYPQWCQYVESYWERRQMWCMAWQHNSTMGHSTDNFCESTIRL